MSPFTRIAGGLALVSALACAPKPQAQGPSQVIHATSADFPGYLAQDKPVIVDFWATWCPPCRIQGPIMDEVSVKVAGKALVLKVDVDQEPRLAAQFGVRSIPTLVILRQGKVSQQFVGVQQAEGLVRALTTP